MDDLARSTAEPCTTVGSRSVVNEWLLAALRPWRTRRTTSGIVFGSLPVKRRHWYSRHPIIPQHLQRHPDTGSRSRSRVHPLEAQRTTSRHTGSLAQGARVEPAVPELARPTIAHADIRATQNHVTRDAGVVITHPSHVERGDMEGTPHKHRGTSGGPTMNWCLSSATSRRDCVMSFFMAKMSERSFEEPLQLTWDKFSTQRFVRSSWFLYVCEKAAWIAHSSSRQSLTACWPIWSARRPSRYHKLRGRKEDGDRRRRPEYDDCGSTCGRHKLHVQSGPPRMAARDGGHPPPAQRGVAEHLRGEPSHPGRRRQYTDQVREPFWGVSPFFGLLLSRIHLLFLSVCSHIHSRDLLCATFTPSFCSPSRCTQHWRYGGERKVEKERSLQRDISLLDMFACEIVFGNSCSSISPASAEPSDGIVESEDAVECHAVHLRRQLGVHRAHASHVLRVPDQRR